MTGVFLAASNPEKLLATNPTPSLRCLASSSLCSGRKAFGWQTLDLTMNWAASVGWSHLEVQEEGVDHCQEQQQLHAHGHEGQMGRLEVRGCLEVRGNQPSLEFLVDPERHRPRVVPCSLAFQNTQEDLLVLVDHFSRLDLVGQPNQTCHVVPVDLFFQGGP